MGRSGVRGTEGTLLRVVSREFEAAGLDTLQIGAFKAFRVRFDSQWSCVGGPGDAKAAELWHHGCGGEPPNKPLQRPSRWWAGVWLGSAGAPRLRGMTLGKRSER